jgi:hypothetical protein
MASRANEKLLTAKDAKRGRKDRRGKQHRIELLKYRQWRDLLCILCGFFFASSAFKAFFESAVAAPFAKSADGNPVIQRLEGKDGKAKLAGS